MKEPTEREKQIDTLSIAVLMNLEFIDYAYHGTIGLDNKRPLGNSDLPGDILEIIGAKMEGDDGDEPCWSSKQREYAMELFKDLPNYFRQQIKDMFDKSLIEGIPERYLWRLKK